MASPERCGFIGQFLVRGNESHETMKYVAIWMITLAITIYLIWRGEAASITQLTGSATKAFQKEKNLVPIS
jgi:hypothetical protein